MRSDNLARERIGEIRKNKLGSDMEVVEYINALSILVKFQQGNPIHTTWNHFKRGNVKNVYDKTIHGIGYVGEGEYITTVNKKSTSQYKTWGSMLQRCHSENYINKFPSYKDCSVTEEWYNFQNFAEWFDQNYYEIEGETMCLDKDILVKGNKIYSPNTCIFVPHFINKLFIKRETYRGDLPIGVTYHKENDTYVASCGNQSNRKYLGSFDTAEEAFVNYKEYKEKLIKQVSEKYKNVIPKTLYEAMYTYKVEIND